MGPVKDEEGMLVNPTPLPVKLVALTVPAKKLPVASRSMMVLGVLPLAASLAATAPLATAEAVCPPTVETTVAPCVPVTSPDNGPVKLVAVVAVLAEVALVAVVALPERVPVKDPLI